MHECQEKVTNEIIYKLEQNQHKYYKLNIREKCGKKGVFIVIEGIDGTGISTYTNIITIILNKMIKNTFVTKTKEPTQGSIGSMIKLILNNELSKGYENPKIMALLYAADRLYNLSVNELHYGIHKCRGVIDCIMNGIIVISDRYKYSSYAYQQINIVENNIYKGANIDWIRIVNQYAITPHILVYIDIDSIDNSIKIIQSEREKQQLYEKKHYLEKIRNNYLNIINQLRDNPEYNPNSKLKPAWAELLGGDDVIRCLYPPQYSYPRIIYVRRRESIVDTSVEIIDRILMELYNLGIII